MSDRERFELELSPGAQPPSDLGDRVLVGLAILVLLGAVVIVAGKLLPEPQDAARASIPPSVAPLQSQPPPAPSAVPRVITVGTPIFEVQVPTQSRAFDGWIRAEEDLVVRSSPGFSGGEVGVLQRGEIAEAAQQNEEDGEPGWLYLQPPAPRGWVATIAGGRPLVTRFSYPHYVAGGSVFGLAAGPDGFAALGAPPSDTATYLPARPFASVDGAVWRAADPTPFGDADTVAIVRGPAGWIVVGWVSGANSLQVWFWSSPDGLTWSRLGALGLPDEYVIQLLGSDHGYLLHTVATDGRPDSFWASTDAVHWREVLDPLLTTHYDGRQVVGMPAGFYTWNGFPSSTAAGLPAFSRDGLTWTSAAAGGPAGANLQVTGLGDGLLAVDPNPRTSEPRVWLGSLAGNTVTWRAAGDAGSAFSDAVVSQVASSNGLAYAFGWDVSTQIPLVWTGDGSHWDRKSLPVAFRGVPQLAAGGPMGVVVLGHRPTLHGDNPIFWHITGSGTWLAEPDPLLEAVPDPSGNACPPIPQDALELMYVDHAAAAACFGDAPISLRAFSVACNDCSGPSVGIWRPTWLLSSGSNQLYLSPAKSDTWWTTATVHPTLTVDPAWAGAWLDLTGHFDDVESSTCHYEPVPEEITYWGGPQSAIDGCRQTFVVTEVALAPV